MTQLLLYIVFVVFLLGAAAVLLRRPRADSARKRHLSAIPAEFFPIHSRYFPQVRHALSAEDSRYLAGRGSPSVYRCWKKSLRHAGRLYLAGLREDFSRLNRLARLLSLYSPHLALRQEVELARLSLQFQFLYGLVFLWFLLDRPAADHLGQMAALIGSLGSRLEQAALALNVGSGALTP
jgi:hypothetical protein